MRFLFLLLLPFAALAQRPNIVWISCEDTSPDFIGCYGNRETRTPNIDALAREGVRFTNAFSTNIVCAPSRNCIITGVRTAESGNGNHRSQYRMPSYVKGFPSYLREAGYFTTNNVKTDYNLDKPQEFTRRQWNISSREAGFEKRSQATQPFFAVYNFTESHQSKTMTFSYARYKKDIESQLKPEEVIKPETVTVLPFYANTVENHVNIARMYNCIQVMDKKVGEIVQQIKDAGQWDNTIVFYFGDHGEGMPRFKNNNARLGSQIPLVVRLPEKYQHLLAQKKGGVNSEYVTFEDFAPTLLSLAGIAQPSYMHGRVFIGEHRGADPKIYWGTRDNTDEVIDMGRMIINDDYVYERTFYPHLPTLQKQAYGEASDIMKEMRRDYAAGKLDSLQASLLQPRSAEYLFNRKTDPWETHNLANDPRYAKQLAQMRAKNEEYMKRYRDMGLMPQTALAGINAVDTPLNWKQSHYDFEKYYVLATTVGVGSKFLPLQMNALKDRDSVARYWAVIGLHSQPVELLNKAAIRKAFLKERSDFVKIELADVLNYLHETSGVDYLTQLVISNNNEYLVRQALLKFVNNRNIPDASRKELEANKTAIIERFKGQYQIYMRSALSSIMGMTEQFDTD